MLSELILVADDDQQHLNLLAIRLRAAGYRVACAHDGYQAVEAARKEAPALLILDINMPAGDGFTVIDRIRNLEGLAAVPVLYLTGDRSESVINHAVDSGARGVIHKPFDTSFLLARIESILQAPAHV